MQYSLTKCHGCGQLTTGSVGAAGIRWSFICQPCKDKADNAEMNRLVKLNEAFEKVFSKLDGSR